MLVLLESHGLVQTQLPMYPHGSVQTLPSSYQAFFVSLSHVGSQTPSLGSVSSSMLIALRTYSINCRFYRSPNTCRAYIGGQVGEPTGE